jgi:pyridoxine/pyridoxamine 5'-phosphate oxidase
MFDNNDLAYFRKRADEEREKAAVASQSAIADIHLKLAAKYESLSEQSQARQEFDGGFRATAA